MFEHVVSLPDPVFFVGNLYLFGGIQMFRSMFIFSASVSCFPTKFAIFISGAFNSGVDVSLAGISSKILDSAGCLNDRGEPSRSFLTVFSTVLLQDLRKKLVMLDCILQPLL